MTPAVLSIGHSNRPLAELIALIRRWGGSAVCDVRSRPFSRIVSQYNRRQLESALADAGVRYIFLGDELGGRPSDRAVYDGQGRVSYSLVARTAAFKKGIERVLRGIEKSFVPVLLCAERDALQCHRSILVGRALLESGIVTQHIFDAAHAETQHDLETRLLRELRIQADLLRGETADSVINRAYETQGTKIAYVEPRSFANDPDQGLHNRIYEDDR